MTLLQIEAQEHDGLAHVVLTGELDLSTIAQVEQELSRVEGEGPATVALDLSRLTFLDSSGLRVIVSADQRARRENRRFVVVRGPDTVQRVFSITRLDEQLDLVDDFGDLTQS
ncbi:MAG TPA: STAS domain-containing protein [Thermoleophilaceae bacterium]|nr:STAS domain-containing protein [Thermoleophilaceae bacterium]